MVTILFDQREKGENKWIIQFRARKKLNGSISDPLTYANVTKWLHSTTFWLFLHWHLTANLALFLFLLNIK